MKIDNENKTVWCSKELAIWIKSFKSGRIRLADDLAIISTLSTDEAVIVPIKLDINDRLKLINAISKGYRFKEIELKYYWRKKKQFVFNFEKVNDTYLNIDINDDYIFMSNTEENFGYYKTKFTEAEAFHILQHDFDKFEKVECEQNV